VKAVRTGLNEGLGGHRGGASKPLGSSPIVDDPARIRIRDEDLGERPLDGAPGA
jgi:hypothetical protein